jgi:hypothetical protein
MSVNWDNVEVPKPEGEAQEQEQDSSPVVTGFFVLLAVAALLGGAAFLNVTVFGNQIKQRAIGDCDGPACVLEVRTTHDECFSERMTFRVPASLDDFQPPAGANHLAFLEVDYQDYVICAGVTEEESP